MVFVVGWVADTILRVCGRRPGAMDRKLLLGIALAGGAGAVLWLLVHPQCALADREKILSKEL